MQTALRESHDLLEQRVQERTAELLRSNADLERFAYVAAHDLQEPLRQTTLYTQLLASRYRAHLDTEAQQAMDFIVEGATRMNTLVKGLLTYSQVGLGANPFQRVDCTVAVQQAIAQLQDALIACGGTVTFDALPALYGDAPLLTQLFHNLISNAIKFRGPEALQVHLSAAALAPVNGVPIWRIAVRDNGIGIAPQYFEQIFAIFPRVHAREEYPGTGIGLALCKRIVEQHAGRIWVDSQLGHGATFFIELPDTRPLDIRATPPSF
jgi:light-regulated signal transduction histidine kinase (bacteriophytochrome)